MRVGFISCQDYHRPRYGAGSSVLRAFGLIKYWPEAELYDDSREYDILVFQKAYWREKARSFTGLKIFDICDPDDNAIPTAELCDVIVTPNEALADYFSFLKKPTYVVPDRHDLDRFTVFKVHDHNKPIEWVVWFGFSSNFAALDRFLPILKKYNLKLRVISNTVYILADEAIIWDWATAYGEIIKGDLVINPPLHKYKSDNKTTTAWLLNMPVACEEIDLVALLGSKDRNIYINRSVFDVRRSVEQYRRIINKHLPECV